MAPAVSGRVLLRYDTCIIGAGADGLAAAAVLASGGLKVIVIERNSLPGGRCVTREFHPGFRASPYVDELPAIPDDIFRSLDLARRGAILAPTTVAAAIWPDGRSDLYSPPQPCTVADMLRNAVIARVAADTVSPPRRRLFAARPLPQPFPGEGLAWAPIKITRERPAGYQGFWAKLCDPADAAFCGLVGPDGGMAAGGLGSLGEALWAAAISAGAEVSCGIEATDLRRKNGRIAGVGLADGKEITARAVISTLDLKRTFLSLFSWNELPRPVVDRVASFRSAPGIARLLVALDGLPDAPAGLETAALRGPIHIVPDTAVCDGVYRAWRAGSVPAHPPALLRVVSAIDPSLAPDGAATLTVTLGGIPHAPLDGSWNREKRDRLRELALSAMESALPGTSRHVIATELIGPPEMENLLGLTDGDLMGGELSAAQMLAFRPFSECAGTRTPVKGLYLAGPSSALGPLATCAAGVTAARAAMSDMAAGRLK
jgi:phytoene dehydrogenase-like protein